MNNIKAAFTKEDYFPYSSQEGSDCTGINQQKIKFLGAQGPSPNQEDVSVIMKRHHEFLSSGGAGGSWRVLLIGDLTVGFYDLVEDARGQQAIFERMNLSKVTLNGLEFPFANFCGVFAEQLQAENANLFQCLFTDSTLSGANFQGAQLQHVDFSRSDLSGANFQGANLIGADFENCNLSKADFRGARLQTASFPGTQLDGARY